MNNEQFFILASFGALFLMAYINTVKFNRAKAKQVTDEPQRGAIVTQGDNKNLRRKLSAMIQAPVRGHENKRIKRLTPDQVEKRRALGLVEFWRRYLKGTL